VQGDQGFLAEERSEAAIEIFGKELLPRYK